MAEGEVQPSFDDLTAEFGRFKGALPKDQQGDSYLWEKFLLAKPENKSWVFGRTLDDTLHGRRNDIARLVEQGKVDEASKLGSITKQLSEKYAKIVTAGQGKK